MVYVTYIPVFSLKYLLISDLRVIFLRNIMMPETQIPLYFWVGIIDRIGQARLGESF